MLPKIYLIADSGSTKTDWILAGKNGMHRFQSDGINPFYQTAEEIVPVLQKQVLPNLTEDPESIFFYGAGCADEKTSKPVFDALRQVVNAAGKIEVATDMLGAARGLCGHEPGLACILGTGANNAFYDGKNIVHSIGSLGFWLGDEGSGSYLGKTLVVHFLQNELPPDLHEAFNLAYPGTDRLRVLDNAYKKPYPNRYFASHSMFIAAHIGHPFLQEMVGNAFRLFTEKYICKHAHAEKYPVHFTGSVAWHYRDVLKKELERKGLRSGRILKSPLEGLVQYYMTDKQ
ncbi:N-acetylglucosamine kinase [Dyadobacter sediminis]|uniref:N-acetylglucosamine kinase n=1 Tax=Dyadobacter sediminis TaxID=1493691 RepID=A0A5R9K7V1_9BACT|nr:N-acetylglucosamine kinase [Dyadobacter sediminis]TLU89947.1 N-acetylglucosamine kinase [Dyadobacter sediminis]GGC11536.1 ATPase [Dyadobacter sediminis]